MKGPIGSGQVHPGGIGVGCFDLVPPYLQCRNPVRYLAENSFRRFAQHTCFSVEGICMHVHYRLHTTDLGLITVVCMYLDQRKFSCVKEDRAPWVWQLI